MVLIIDGGEVDTDISVEQSENYKILKEESLALCDDKNIKHDCEYFNSCEWPLQGKPVQCDRGKAANFAFLCHIFASQFVS